jgi:hypothetical protein
MKCPDCGQPLNECTDPDRDLFAYRRICNVTMVQKAAEADYQALHKDRPYHNGDFTDWSATRSSKHPFHFEWAVTIGVAPVDVNPHDEFRAVEKQSPYAPSEEDSGVPDQSGENAHEGHP